MRVGSRLRIEEFLAREVEAGWIKIEVVVSGPGSLCDDARALVDDMCRRCVEFRLYRWFTNILKKRKLIYQLLLRRGSADLVGL